MPTDPMMQTDVDAEAERALTPRVPTRVLVVGIIGAALALAAVFLLGRALAPMSTTPSNTSAEAGFARDMQTHHLQAVELSRLVTANGVDADIRLLAYDISTTQQQQAGQMFAWLQLWGLSQAPAEPEMTWMTRPTLDGGGGHDHGGSGAGSEPEGGSEPEAGSESGAAHVPGAPMPGYATPEQLAALAAASGSEADRIYLELMIEHHIGGVDMAVAVLDRSEHSVVTGFATAMIAAQQTEIDYMRGLLER